MFQRPVSSWWVSYTTAVPAQIPPRTDRPRWRWVLLEAVGVAMPLVRAAKCGAGPAAAAAAAAAILFFPLPRISWCVIRAETRLVALTEVAPGSQKRTHCRNEFFQQEFRCSQRKKKTATKGGNVQKQRQHNKRGRGAWSAARPL